ncbi:MAG: hypothetical protein ACK5LJ_13515 [Paracoccus sp. (in: a-proteobacteria)]
MTQSLDWILIGDEGGARLGAIGFLGDEAAAIALFEAGAQIALLIAAARSRREVFSRDPGIAQLIGHEGAAFPRALPLDAAWSDYFRPGIAMATRGADRQIHGRSLARILPRRGSEAALNAAIRA